MAVGVAKEGLTAAVEELADPRTSPAILAARFQCRSHSHMLEGIYWLRIAAAKTVRTTYLAWESRRRGNGAREIDSDRGEDDSRAREEAAGAGSAEKLCCRPLLRRTSSVRRPLGCP